MKFEREDLGDVLLLIPQPEKRGAGGELMALKAEVSRLIEEGAASLLVDLRQVDFINSTDIGALVGCVRHAQQKKRVFALCGLGLRLAETLHIVQMHRVLPFRLTREEAILDMRKAVKAPNPIPALVGGNPDMEQVKQWWDTVILSQTTPPATPSPVPPPPAAAPPIANRIEEILASEQTPPETRPYLHDWIHGLEVLRSARDLWEKRGLSFDANITFKEFITKLAESLIAR